MNVANEAVQVFASDADAAIHEAEEVMRDHALCTDDCPLRSDARKMIATAAAFKREREAIKSRPYGLCSKTRSR
jgi:rRNA-processing protein FCF1